MSGIVRGGNLRKNTGEAGPDLDLLNRPVSECVFRSVHNVIYKDSTETPEKDLYISSS